RSSLTTTVRSSRTTRHFHLSPKNRNIETSLRTRRASLRQEISDIGNSLPETTPLNAPISVERTQFSASETDVHTPKRRKYRAFSQKTEIARRDGTGWLGREDSNLRMAE